MTVVRLDATLDPNARRALAETLRGQPDVVGVVEQGDAIDVELAGYARDAANARAIALARTCAEEISVDPAGLTVAPHADAGPGGLGA